MVRKKKEREHKGGGERPPFLSIVMPVLETPPLVTPWLMSVYMQCPDYEVVIADATADGGMLGYYEELLSRHANGDLYPKVNDIIDRTRYIRVPEECHGFPGAVKNLAGDASSGRWIAFLETGDFLMQNFLSDLKDAVDLFPESQMASCDFSAVYYDRYADMMYPDTLGACDKAGGTYAYCVREIRFGGRGLNFVKDLPVYRNRHPYRSAEFPVIMRRDAWEGCFHFLEDVPSHEGIGWHLQSVSLSEVCTDRLGYLHVLYPEYASARLNDDLDVLSASEDGKSLASNVVELDDTFKSVNYVKPRSHLSIDG